MKKKKNGRKFFSFFVILIFCAVLVLPIHHAAADWGGILPALASGDPMSAVMNLIAALFRGFFLNLAGLVVWIGAYFIDVFLDPNLYNVVLSSNAITVGWTTVRDFCNMFYVFFMLLIAFSTIVRNDAYNAKNLLPKVIISLFLINFSMVIAKIVIDFGQIFLFGMAGWMGSFSGASGAGSPLTSIVDYFQTQFGSSNNPSSSTIFLIVFASAYCLLLGILYAVLALFLLARLVAFVILIIVSPFAFFSMVLPSMRTYTSRWWKSLFNNAISGPVFVFFLYISAVMAQDLYGFTSSVDKGPQLGLYGSFINLLVINSIPLLILWAAIPITQELSAAGSKQIVGGTGGFGKVLLGAYAGYKIGEKAVTGTARFGHAEMKGWKPYRESTEKWGTKLANNVLIGRGYLKHQANNAQKMDVRVKGHMDVMKSFSPERMLAYVNSFKIDRNAQADAKAAMHQLLRDKGKTTDADYMKVGYKKKGLGGEDELDREKLQNDLQIIPNHGGDVSDTYKQRPDLLIKEDDIVKEINKALASNKLSDMKLDIRLDPRVKNKMEELVPKEQLRTWMNSKSTGEKEAYVAKRELQAKHEAMYGNPATGEKLDVKGEGFKNFQEEAALLSRGTKKTDRLRQVVGVEEDKDKKPVFIYEKDSEGKDKIDMALADRVLKKTQNRDLLDLDNGPAKKIGALMSKNQNKYLGNNANPELIEAVKSSIKKQQSLSENDRDVKGISEKEWQARLAALEQAWRDNSAPAESTE